MEKEFLKSEHSLKDFTLNGKREKPEKLFEEIMAENFPNLGRDRHLGPGIPESPKMNPYRTTSRHSKIKTLKFKVKRRILKVAREKIYYIPGKPHKAISRIFRNFIGQKEWQHIQSVEKKKK